MAAKPAGDVKPGGAADAPAQNWRERLAAANVNTGSPALDETIRRQLRNPDLFLYKLKSTAYKLSFMLIPILLPFLWLMFIGRPGVALYDHAVFSLYSLSFMSLLFIVATLLSRIGMAAPALLAVPPVHVFLQLREVLSARPAGCAVAHGCPDRRRRDRLRAVRGADRDDCRALSPPRAGASGKRHSFTTAPALTPSIASTATG
jgi:hypothetical protein